MPDFAAPVERLIDELKHLPGIGQKTAQRLAFYLLRATPEEALALADAIRDAKEKIKTCSTCHNITDTDPCLYCVGPTRSKRTICVVEEPHNIMAVEKTRTYSGMYHVLGGSLSPLQGRGPDQLHIKSLIERLKGSTVEEIIIATNPTAEGEATAVYLSKLLKPLGGYLWTNSLGQFRVNFFYHMNSSPVMNLADAVEKHADPRQTLLGECGDRPSRHRAEERNEPAPPHFQTPA